MLSELPHIWAAIFAHTACSNAANNANMW